MEKILDIREIAKEDRDPSIIIRRFNDLEPGDSFELINDHDPQPLLEKFQGEREGEFDWWVLEQGPEVWRITIGKLREPEPDRTITDYLQTDHRRLDRLYDRFQEDSREGRWEDAARGIREFSLGLKRHIGIEEEILFPVFEEKTGMVDAGPTHVMRMEHTEIKDLLDKLVAAADAKNGEDVKENAYHLTNYLADHNMKEEHILYPESDSFLSEAERIEVVKKAQAV